MTDSNVSPLGFDPVDGLTVRGAFDGGALSSDMGPLLLRGLDQHIGLTECLAAAVVDGRHPSYTQHAMADLLAQRTYQVASAFEDGNDANILRHDPMFQMGVGRQPVAEDSALASGATFSRPENAISTKDIYRMASAYSPTIGSKASRNRPIGRVFAISKSVCRPTAASFITWDCRNRQRAGCEHHRLVFVGVRLGAGSHHQGRDQVAYAVGFARQWARVEYIFRILKCQFKYCKVRYKALAKNQAQAMSLMAMANLYLLRRQLMA